MPWLSLETQNRLRERYRKSHSGWRPATEVFATLVQTNLEPGSRVLDLGCGRGGLIEQLDHPLFQVIGLDPDLLSLTEHRLSDQGLSRINGLGDRLPFAGSCFDLVFASWVLEHLPWPEKDFREIGRILKPGGCFIFITPNRRHPLSVANSLAGRFGAIQGRVVQRLYGRAAADAFPTTYQANDRQALDHLGKATGLQLEYLEVIRDPTYLVFTPRLFRLANWFERRLPASRGIHLVGCYRC